MSGKGFLGNMTENLQADCVQSRQAGFVWCCLYPENAPEKTLSSIVPHFSGVVNILPQLCRICGFDHRVPQKIAATNLPIRETEKLVKEFYIELFHQLYHYISL